MNLTTNKIVGALSFDSKPIGKGKYGTVYKGFYRSCNVLDEAGQLKPVAVKRLEKSIDDSTIEQEVKNMQMAGDHPNIVSFIHSEMNDEYV